MKLTTFATCLAATLIAGVLNMPVAQADDIDIFIGSTSGGGTPNVMFLVDNSSNWSKASQKWPDQATQGQAELDAIVRISTNLYNAHVANPAKNPAVNIGYSELTDTPPNNAGHAGGYVRFGVRDVVTNLTNLKALANILGYGSATPPNPPAIPPPLTVAAPSTSIYNNINAPAEKYNEADKDETAAFYEIYKYFNSLDAFTGSNAIVSGDHNPGAAWDDYPGASGAQSAKGQGLTSGYALSANGKTYTGPSGAQCSKNYLIYIANNANRASAWPSSITYETADASPIIGPTLGLGAFYTMYDREWVRFLNKNNIQVFVLDAFNAQQNVQYSTLLRDAVGTNNYYQVGSEAAILAAISDILVKIQSTNSAFAATALPASATNRSVDQNQVYLGVFRPDQNAAPKWYGNLKRYQIILQNGVPALGDAANAPAVNNVTGFLADCAVSYWTSDTSGYIPGAGATATPYWSLVTSDQPSPSSACPAPGGSSSNPAGGTGFPVNGGATWSPFSDLPDGPIVEKGGAAEVLRSGNGGTAWQETSRQVLTLNGTTISAFPLGTETLATFGTFSGTAPTVTQVENYIKGWDALDENGNGFIDPPSTTTETRPSIHGDVIHSTPRPITYGSSAGGVTVYYGSNDGMFHAVNASTGIETWAFLAPEFESRMARLYQNSPQINYPNLPSGITPVPVPKGYGFDGPTGLYQNSDNSKVWIFPTMRRGGRMIYALDVSSTSGTAPNKPGFLWKAGCPSMANNTGCTAGMNSIGQTWSVPQATLLKDGATNLAPLVIIGGGEDSTQTVDGSGNIVSTSCEDQNTNAPSCAGRTGNVVYILDGHGSGGAPSLIRTFTLPSTHGTPGSVVGDVALLDINGDGYTDYAYFGDTNGFVYRLDFVDGPTTLNPLTNANWRITQIAGVSNAAGFGRKFMFAPTLFLNQNKVFVGLGTGDREHPLITEYPTTTPVTNHFYLFVDDPATTSTYLNLDGTTVENATGATCNSPNVLPGNTAAPSATSPVGWSLPLTANGVGEQTVTPAVIIGGQVSWGTNRPLPAVAGTCTNGLGEARGYLVSLLNGSGAIGVNGECGGTDSTTYPGGGLPIPPTEATIPVTGPPGCTTNCSTTYVGVCIGCPAKSGGSGSEFQPEDVAPPVPATRRRVYWFTPDDK
jgi:type IV pilus assembly protein PilY1